MTNLTESPIYEAGIFQLEKTTPPLGGAPAFTGPNPSAGHANVQALQLANRTAYLKQMLDTGGGQLALDLANNTDPLKGATKVGWDGGTVADVLAYSKAVSNYTTLRAYTGSATTVRVLARNIEGLFYYDPSDSTSLDDGGIIIVGSDGRRWKRYYASPVSIRWFGATGDGTTDDYPAIQLAFNWAQSYVKGKSAGVNIHFPFGEYRMSQQAICDLVPAGTPLTGAVGINLVGDGPAETLIVAMPSNTTGCFRLTSGKNLEAFAVRHMAFLSHLPEDAPTNNGIALTIDSAIKRGDPGYGDQPRWSVILDDLWVAGYGKSHSDIARAGNWLKGIYIADKYHPKLSNIRCLARYSGTLGARTASEYAIHMHACYSSDLSHIYIHGSWEYGVWLDDLYNAPGGWEDFRLVDSFIAGPNFGFGVVHDNDIEPSSQLTEPGGLISGLHLNARKHGITIRNHHQVIIEGLYAYAPREERADGELLPSCILLDNASDIMIRGEFLEPGFYNSNSNASVAVRIETASECIMIEAQFGHGGIGVLNNSTATTRKTIVVNALLTTSRRIIALWAPLTLLVDNAKTATLQQNIQGNSQDVKEFASGKPNAATYPMAVRARALEPGNDYGGALELSGTDTAGALKHLAILRSRLLTKTLGSEDSVLSMFIMGTGSTAEAFRLQAPSIDNDSWGYLLFRQAGAPVLKRVKMGGTGTGPGGVGRAIYVDN